MAARARLGRDEEISRDVRRHAVLVGRPRRDRGGGPVLVRPRDDRREPAPLGLDVAGDFVGTARLHGLDDQDRRARYAVGPVAARRRSSGRHAPCRPSGTASRQGPALSSCWRASSRGEPGVARGVRRSMALAPAGRLVVPIAVAVLSCGILVADWSLVLSVLWALFAGLITAAYWSWHRGQYPAVIDPPTPERPRERVEGTRTPVRSGTRSIARPRGRRGRRSVIRTRRARRVPPSSDPRDPGIRRRRWVV